ncbi:hypothetical protein EON80_08480, partial [bacterium]
MSGRKLLVVFLLLVFIVSLGLQLAKWNTQGFNSGLGLGEVVALVAFILLSIIAPSEARTISNGRLRGPGRLLLGMLVLVF